MAWDFNTDAEFQAQLDWIRDFVNTELIPLEPILPLISESVWEQEVMPPLKQKVKDRGLWACHLDHELGGQGFGQLKLALMSMETGRCSLAMEVFGNQAPDSGNSELLAVAATDEQKEKWLWPNLSGKIRSAFALTEPFTAGADPTQIETTAVLDGDEWVLNGRKWMISNGSRADFVLVFAVTDPDLRSAYQHCSVFVVEKGTPGFNVFRDIPSMHDLNPEFGAIGNHAEILLENVRIPQANLIGARGAGFMLVQVRLGPGRIHHSMRWLGQAQRAYEMLLERTKSRSSFGKGYSSHQSILHAIAESKLEIESAKLFCLQTAWKMDNGGARACREDIGLVKVQCSRVLMNVIDRALQVHGSLGYSCDMPLEEMYRLARMAPLVDGPNEVHLDSAARKALKNVTPVVGWPSEHIPTRREQALKDYGHFFEKVQVGGA